jgi:hypothetical protein
MSSPVPITPMPGSVDTADIIEHEYSNDIAPALELLQRASVVSARDPFEYLGLHRNRAEALPA